MSLQIERQGGEPFEVVPTEQSIQKESVIAARSDFQDQRHQELQKTYCKAEFMTILTELGQEDPFYYCERRQLELIYDQVVEAKSQLNGKDIADFAQALKESNKESFEKEISFYRAFARSCKQNGDCSVGRKEFLKCITDSSLNGYLTESLYPLVESHDSVSLKKLEELLDSIQTRFVNEGVIYFPKKVSISEAEIMGNELIFENAIDELTRERFEAFRELLEESISIDHSEQCEVLVRQLQNIKLQSLDIKQSLAPQLEEEILQLKKERFEAQSEVSEILEQIQDSNAIIVNLRSEIVDLTEAKRSQSKEFIEVKIKLNEMEEQNYELMCRVRFLECQVVREREGVQEFMKEYADLKKEYEGFVAKKAQEDEERRTEKQKNMFPTLSLKEQLEDAHFKVKKLKEQKVKLSKQLQTHEQQYMVKIEVLERELSEARHQATNLKETGMSRLSRNFEVSRVTNRQSMFSSIMSVMQQSSHNEDSKNKMAEIIRNSQSTLLEQSKLKVESKNAFLKKDRPCEVVALERDLERSFDFKQVDTAQLEKELEKEEPLYNFYEKDFESLKNALGKENLSIIEEALESEESDRSEIVLRKQASPEQQLRKKLSIFVSPCEIVSKSGAAYRKYIILNSKALYYFDTKLRLQREVRYSRIRKIVFTHFNTDMFILFFKRSESPMKKSSNQHSSVSPETDLIFRCLKTKQLLHFLSQQQIKNVLKSREVRVTVDKESQLWIKASNEKDLLLSTCGNMYNPFKLNLSLKNFESKFFYAEISRQALLSRSFVTICVVESFGVYCFEWDSDELQEKRNFVHLLPLVKRMKLERDLKSSLVKIYYSEWSGGKTFLLRFKNHRESSGFVQVCERQREENMKALNFRRQSIIEEFANANTSELKNKSARDG